MGDDAGAGSAMVGRIFHSQSKSMKTPCVNCEAPQRTLWVMFGLHRKPIVSEEANGNWISLERCDTCGSLWCASPYEPYASFSYLVAWSDSQEAWKRIHGLDEGKTLLAWHAYAIAAYWRSLPKEEQEEVEAHRKRSYGRNPIDDPSSFGAAPLPRK